MKVFLRVVIVILLLGALGLGAYAIFFKPANNDAVFLALSKVSSEENGELYDTALIDISNTEFKISDSDFSTLLKPPANRRDIVPTKAEFTTIQKGEGLFSKDTEVYDEKGHKKAIEDYIKTQQYDVVNEAFKGLFVKYSKIINGGNLNENGEEKVYLRLRDLLTQLTPLDNLDDKGEETPDDDIGLHQSGPYLITLSIQDPSFIANESKVDNGYTFQQYSYPDLKRALDEAFNYYLAYTQAVTKDVPSSELKSIKKLISEYQQSFDDLRTKFVEIKDFQNERLAKIYNSVIGVGVDAPNEELLGSWTYSTQQIKDRINGVQDAVEEKKFSELAGEFKQIVEENDYSGELEKRYKICITYFRDYLHTYATLVGRVSNFVTEYVFGGEQLADIDSVFYDLMVSAIKNSTNNYYSFGEFESRKAEDMKMIDATKFVKFAYLNKTYRESQINNIYYFGEKEVVEYGGNLFAKFDNARYIASLRLQVVQEKDGNKSLYFGSGEVNDQRLKFETTDNFQIVEDQTGGGYIVKMFNSQKDFHSSGGNGGEFIELTNVVVYEDGKNVKLCLYSDLINSVSNSIILDGISVDENPNNIQFEKGGKIYTSICKSVRCYVINSKVYGINENWEVCQFKTDKPEFVAEKVDNETVYTVLSGAVYHPSTFYAKVNYEEKGEKLNYDTMIKYYRELVKNSPESLDTMMALTLEDKRKFVNENVEVRSNFKETTHDAIAYILACFGFVAE